MCCCCPPRTGGFVIAGFQTGFNGIFLVVNILAVINISNLMKEKKASEELTGIITAKIEIDYSGIRYSEDQFEVIFGVAIAVCVFHGIGGFLLFVGLVQESVGLMKIWIGMRVAGIVGDIVYMSVLAKKIPSVTIISFSLGILITLYFFFVIYTVILEIRQKEMNNMASAHNSVKPHPNPNHTV